MSVNLPNSSQPTRGQQPSASNQKVTSERPHAIFMSKCGGMAPWLLLWSVSVILFMFVFMIRVAAAPVENTLQVFPCVSVTGHGCMLEAFLLFQIKSVQLTGGNVKISENKTGPAASLSLSCTLSRDYWSPVHTGMQLLSHAERQVAAAEAM